MTVDTHHKYFPQNLKLTHEYLVNNYKDKLVTKFIETYLSYQPEQSEGTLFLKIILYVFQDNSDETVEYLVNIVKTLKITEYNGENVNTVVSIIYIFVSCLSNLSYESVQRTSPIFFSDYLLEVFNTTSVTKFNALFAHYSIAKRLTKFQTNTYNKPWISNILSFKETQYCYIHLIGQWSGVDTKINYTSFIDITNVNCFNCGGNNPLKDFCKPQNEERIKPNNKILHDQNKKYKGKWCEKKGNECHKKCNRPRPPPPPQLIPEGKSLVAVIFTERDIIITIKTNSGKLWTIQLHQR